jgi:hypothetical protein
MILIVGSPVAPRSWHPGAHDGANACAFAAPVDRSALAVPSSLCCCSARVRVSLPPERGSRDPHQGTRQRPFFSLPLCFLSATNGQTRPLRGRRRVRPVSLRNRFPTRRRLEFRHDLPLREKPGGEGPLKPLARARRLVNCGRQHDAKARIAARHPVVGTTRMFADAHEPGVSGPTWQSATDVVPRVPPGAA